MRILKDELGSIITLDSFFFNITDRRYKLTKLYEKDDEHITRVDISNGIVFFDINLTSDDKREFRVKNLDRMVVVPVVKSGSFSVLDNKNQKTYLSCENSIDIYCSSRQDLTLCINKSKKTNIFVLFIADFFLKRYLSGNKNESIDFLYEKIQDELSLEFIDTKYIDALSLYIIDKIIDTKLHHQLHSIKCEHSVIEFMIHRFSLLDMIDKDIDKTDLQIAKKAKNHLLKNFISPPTIQTLAHQCATNESKLKQVFKKVYKLTIHSYIQKMRLEQANLLLKEQVLNIGQIAKEVGYKHQGHFSKLFFETYGVYPKDLLKVSK